MDAFERLELNTETLRELTGNELANVAGGARPIQDSGLPCDFYVTYLCPSGETWTMACNFDSLGC